MLTYNSSKVKAEDAPKKWTDLLEPKWKGKVSTGHPAFSGYAKLNAVDPQAWLADVLARIAGYPASRIDELLPWNWRKPNSVHDALAA